AASAIERREMQTAWYEDRDYVPVTERGAAVQAARRERALLAELRARLELARETWTHAREDGADRVTAGLAALRAAAQKHAVEREHGREHERDVVQEQAREHTLEAGSLRERLARILDRGIDRKEAEVAQEKGPEHEEDDIRARLGRILKRDVEQDQAEAAASALGQESQSIRDRLQAVLAREKAVVREEYGHDQGEVVHRHKDRGRDHEL
ncbi:MAG: hypothetical protein Q4F04_13315, partial [Paracoccus sp. (in: a-proteobacteria)]|nr:hypothetical protein [Paracoccus sp. (in: a-proteobacteria)]